MSSTTGLGRVLARATLWSAANTAFLRLAQLGVSIVVARLVSPQQFGVFVVALVTYQIVINISEVGVSAALVREIDNADRIAPTVATIAIITSSALAAIMFASAPVLAAALGAPDATNAVRVLALPLLLAGPTAVPAALLTRDFNQRTKMIIDLSSFVVANGALIVLALQGQGAMALAWSRVAGQSLSAILLFIVVSHRYRPGFDRSEARRLLRFGMPLAGANLAGFTLANVDFMVIGRLAGAVQLGYYNLAYTVSSWPPNVLTVILQSLTLPVLARIRGGISEIGRHVSVTLSAVSAASFPVSACCVVLAQPLITIVYGHRWAPAAAMLVVLAVLGSARVIISLFSDILVAMDRTRQLFRLQLLWLAFLVPVMLLAVHFGQGVGAGVAHVLVAITAVFPAYLLVLVRSIGLPLKALVNPAGYPLVAAVGAGLVSYVVASQGTTPLMKVGLGFGSFLVTYLVVLSRWLMILKRDLIRLYGGESRGQSEDSADMTDVENFGPAELVAVPAPTAHKRGKEEAL